MLLLDGTLKNTIKVIPEDLSFCNGVQYIVVICTLSVTPWQYFQLGCVSMYWKFYLFMQFIEEINWVNKWSSQQKENLLYNELFAKW